MVSHSNTPVLLTFNTVLPTPFSKQASRTKSPFHLLDDCVTGIASEQAFFLSLRLRTYSSGPFGTCVPKAVSEADFFFNY